MAKKQNRLMQARGNLVAVYFEDGRKCVFGAGGRKRFLEEEVYDGIGHVVVNGQIRFADGTKAYCLLEADESSSGEHCGTGVFLPCGGFVWQGDTDFAKKLGKTSAQVFPYTYKYSATLHCQNHHIGSDGWSQ